MSKRRETLVCGDIGGTNTRLALIEVEVNAEFIKLDLQTVERLPGKEIFSKRYTNADFPTFADALQTFLYKDANVSHPPFTACLAIAGPVRDNRVRLTNRDSWLIDGNELAKAFHIHSVSLVNDFLAMGYGLLTLDKAKECVVLQQGELQQANSQPMACVGAGTGLGECYLTPDRHGKYTCFPCEGGHTDFAPRDQLQEELLHFIRDRHHCKHRISVERVASGSGLSNVYDFLVQHSDFRDQVNSDLHTKITTAADKAREIAINSNEDPICRKTMEIFMETYGSEAGNAVLKYLPLGGLYLTGGLTPKNLAMIKDPEGPFLAAFQDKGRMIEVIRSVPLYAVLVEDLGERGAQFVALDLLQRALANHTENKSSCSNVCHWALGMTAAGIVGASVALVAIALSKKLSK
eukprot:gene10528-11665_t